uniref:Uncharacterized protein n=1 Tax=Falco tinnunculus TaxID=100819 RepID=A0A8C4U1R1_FALTI
KLSSLGQKFTMRKTSDFIPAQPLVDPNDQKAQAQRGWSYLNHFKEYWTTEARCTFMKKKSLFFFLFCLVLEFDHVYLEKLPCPSMYECSYMHRDVITHVACTTWRWNVVLMDTKTQRPWEGELHGTRSTMPFPVTWD